MSNWLNSLSVFRRIFGGFLVIISLVILVSLISYTQLHRFRQTTDEAIPTSQLLQLFQRYTENLSTLDSDIERYLVIGGAEIRDNVELDSIALAQVVDEIELIASSNLANDVLELQVATQHLVTSATELINIDGVGSRDRNEQMLQTFDAVEHAHEILQQSVEETLTQLETTITNQEDIVATVLSQQIILGIVVIIIASLGSILITRSIVNPLTHIISITTNIARGDYSRRLNITSQDEIGQLSLSISQMATSIQEREISLQDLNQSLEKRVAERTIELKEARDDALASQRIANENSRLKSEFLSMMSHELRTPMNAIQGFTGIMLKRMAGVEFNDKAERYLVKVQSNSERLLGLINDFLDLSRIESGRLELAHLPMAPMEMAGQWKDNLSVLADNKKLEFKLELDPNLPETMYGDEESISKIAINLVGNAIKFTEEGSITLSLKQEGNQMELQVNDTGIGIPPHARDYIFDEFRQVDQSSKRVHGGTGLGLSIVQKLAIAMGGTVTLQSEVGVGSTFTVLLPIHTEDIIVNGVG